MKIGVLLRSSAHLPYVYNIINELGNTHTVVLILERGWDKKIKEKVANSTLLKHNVKLLRAPAISKWQRLLLEFKEIVSAIQYINQYSEHSFYTKRWLGYLKRPARILARKIAKHSNDKNLALIKSILAKQFSTSRHKSFIEKNQIDKILATSSNLRFSGQEFFICSASSNKIPTYGMILTWDNVTTKSIMLNVPDKIFCWNQFHQTNLINKHSISANNIIQVGPIYFEKWLKLRPEEVSSPKKEFNILYLGSSANITGKEERLLERLIFIAEKFFSNNNKRKLQISYKSHPAKKIKLNSIYNAKNYDDFGLTVKLEDEKQLAQMFAQQDLIIGVNTTALIEATFVNKNVFTLMDAPKRTDEIIPHFLEMIESYNIKQVTLGFNEDEMENLTEICSEILSNDTEQQKTNGESIVSQPSKIIAEYIGNY